MYNIQVYWIHEGQGIHSIDFCDYEILPDRIFFIRPEQVHAICPKGKIRYSAIQFTEEFFHLYAKAIDDELSIYTDLTDEAMQQRLRVLFQQIADESGSKLSGKTNMLQGEIYLLMTELHRCNENVRKQLSLPEILTNYHQLIECHFRKKHQVAEYAKMLGISPNYLNVLSRKHLGQSALHMISSRIVLKIKRLLMENEKTVSELAYSVGFYELSYFSRFFHRMEGVSPQEFRERMNEMYQK